MSTAEPSLPREPTAAGALATVFRHQTGALVATLIDFAVMIAVVHAGGTAVAGTAVGRRSDDQITLYKSVGVAVQDLAAAALVLRAARERGAGLEIELEEISV